jgi:penicillin-binding protein 1C
VAAFAVLDRAFPPPVEALRRPPAVVVVDRDGSPLRVFLPPDGRLRLPVDRGGFPEELRRAVVESEDRWFRLHPGVNPLAILRAAWDNARAGRVVSGGSTIPMQLARLAEPRPRTLKAKLVEAFRALQIERRFGKDELLELYLNNVPCGGNLEGVGAAAAAYFGKEAGRLSLGETALLAVLPRAPAAYDPTLHPEAARAARDRALRRWLRSGAFGRDAVERARLEPIPAARRRPPFEAPHLAQLALVRAPGAPRVVTTLDRRIQSLAEAQVAARIAALRNRGIGNAAAVVVENEGREVRALVGSAGFTEAAFQGQVNLAAAPRSPGSALKPFLYALAVDQGRIVPDSYLLDVPTDFSGYVAENYDGRYRGRVTAREALVQSLNAPAVRLLAETGLAEFHALLTRGGLGTLDRPAARYGLPLILGAGEVTLLDLTNLYATLAQGGRHLPWRILPGGGRPAGRLFSAGAARLVSEILAEIQRPDLPAAWHLTRDVPAVAWKTGTSFAHRDAWAVGFSARMSIGVWVGNPDGRALKGISGAEDAAPLLFDLFRAVEGGSTRLPEPAGARVEPIAVCALSHDLPGPHCPERTAILHVPGRTRLPACALHRRVFLDPATGAIVSGRCLASRPHVARTITVFPDELVAFWRAQGQPVPPAPTIASGCPEVPSEEPPRIVSPVAATPYRIRRDAPIEHQQIPLIARASAGADRLWWYQDGVLVASGPPAAPLFVPPARGAHRIVVVDGAGRSDGVTYSVQ